mmetsp:Transcript_10802/g.21564  ORF Transcript_10802/g.21564 Transcript_10802/m.21564 type:complete len:219 (-) Transcript_10802:368-1024(-)
MAATLALRKVCLTRSEACRSVPTETWLGLTSTCFGSAAPTPLPLQNEDAELALDKGGGVADAAEELAVKPPLMPPPPPPLLLRLPLPPLSRTLNDCPTQCSASTGTAGLPPRRRLRLRPPATQRVVGLDEEEGLVRSCAQSMTVRAASWRSHTNSLFTCTTTRMVASMRVEEGHAGNTAASSGSDTHNGRGTGSPTTRLCSPSSPSSSPSSSKITDSS